MIEHSDLPERLDLLEYPDMIEHSNLLEDSELFGLSQLLRFSELLGYFVTLEYYLRLGYSLPSNQVLVPLFQSCESQQGGRPSTATPPHNYFFSTPICIALLSSCRKHNHPTRCPHLHLTHQIITYGFQRSRNSSPNPLDCAKPDIQRSSSFSSIWVAGLT